MPPFFTLLPESIWSEVNRRIRVERTLRDLLDQCEDDTRASLAAACQTVEMWRPGIVGKVYLQVKGQERRNKGQQLPELAQATLAALNLKERLQATQHFASLAHDAKNSLRDWSIPLICLYAIIPNPSVLIKAMLDQELIALAARILVANETPQSLISNLNPFITNYSVAIKLSLANHFTLYGLPEVARTFAPKQAKGTGRLNLPSDLPSAHRALADQLDHIFLSDYSAQPISLSRAIESSLSLATDLTLRHAHRALDHNDPVSALAAFREARTMRPKANHLHVFVAEAMAAMGDTQNALVELGAQTSEVLKTSEVSTRVLLAAARVYYKAGNHDLAHELLIKIRDSNESDTPSLSSCADLLIQLGDADSAAQLWNKILTSSPSPAPLHLNLAKHYLAHGDQTKAQDHAWAALGFDPENALARKILAQSLRHNDPASAITHYQRAIARDPDPKLQLELAQTALEAHQPELAFQISEFLKNSEILTSEVLIIAGKALTALGKTNEAFEYFNRATDLTPASSEAWRAVAAHHRAQNDLQRALAALQAGCKYCNDDPDLYADLGDLYLILNQPIEAIQSFNQTVRLDPGRGQIHKRLGELYHAQHRHKEALESLQRALINVHASDRSPIETVLGRTLEALGRFDEALAVYQRAHSSAVGGVPVDLLRDLGRVAYQLNHHAIARPALESVVKDHDDADSLTLLGAIYEQAKEFKAALQTYQRALAIDPKRSELIVQLGVCCLELKQHEAAIAALRDAAENDKTNFSLQKTLAQAYAAAGLWEEAVNSYEAASRLAPDDHLLLSTLAHCARKAGNTAYAAKILKQAIELAPEMPGYRQELAELLAASNQLEMARTLYLEALRIAPNSVMILVGLGDLYLKLKDFGEAVLVFEKATSLDPSRADIVKALGEANVLLGRFDPAQTAFARAAAIDPLNPDHLRRAGECLWQLARHASAIALWKKNLLQHPNDAATHAKLGAALSHQGKHLEAFTAYQRAAQESPQDISLALETARAALTLQNFDSALPHLERASKLTPNDHTVWQMLGETYHAKGLNDRALSALEHAVQLAPHLGKPQAEMARVYLHLGKRAEANAAAEAAIELDPNSTDVLAAAAEVFVQTNRHAQGVAASRKVAKGRPDDAESLMNLTRALILEKESAPIGNFSKVEGTERAEIMNQLERAADLGADANAVNVWKARALALFGNFKEAIPLLEAAVAKTPTAEIYCALASCYRRAGKLTLARKAIESSLEREPTNVSNLIERGRIILEQGDVANARENFERVINLDPQNATAHQLLGECFQASGKRIEAASVYQKAITLDPKQAAWHHRLAELYESRRETSSAIQHYQNATDLAQKQNAHPHETANYVAALARAYARLNDLAHAADQFDRALILRDDVQAWWAQCGEINLTLKNFERAWECFDHADDLASLIGAARAALALNRNDDAQEKILAALHLNSDNADALLLLAEVYMRRADYDNALSAYGTAANVADDPRAALTAQATLLMDLDQPMKAVGALKRVLTLDPQDDEAMGMLSDAMMQAKHVDEAIEAGRHANQLAPHKASHLLRLGKLCGAVGQLDAALAHLQTAREIEPQEAEIAREMGLVYERRNQPHRALELYQELIQLQPGIADNFFLAGLAAKSMRDYVEAAHFFKRASELDPTNLEIQKQRLAVSATGILKMVSG